MHYKSYGEFIAQERDGIIHFTNGDADFYDMQAHDLALGDDDSDTDQGRNFDCDWYFVAAENVIIQAETEVGKLASAGLMVGVTGNVELVEQINASNQNLTDHDYWTFDGDRLAHNEPTLEKLKANALAAIEEQHASYLRKLTGSPTDEESKTWPTKSAAAYAFVEGTANAGQLKFLNAAAARASVDASVIANRIIAKSEPYLDLVGRADGFRATAKQAVASASTPQEVQQALETLELAAQTEATDWKRQYAGE